MDIPLSKIKPPPYVARTTRLEEQMEGLVQSIGEWGLLQAVKLRPAGDEYEIVFGHRRVEACRRAGYTHIEAIVEEVDDRTALIQAIVENIQRKNIADADEGHAYVCLRDEFKLKPREIAQLVGKGEWRVGRCILLVEDEAMQKLSHAIASDAAEMAVAIRGAVGDDAGAREAFAAKVVDEGLTRAQTRQVAEAVKRTQDPEARKLLLETPGVPTPAMERVARYVVEEEKEGMQRWWNTNGSEASKAIVRLVKRHHEEYKEVWLGVERGAVAPEHMPYIEKRLRSLSGFLLSLADDLESLRKEAFE